MVCGCVVESQENGKKLKGRMTRFLLCLWLLIATNGLSLAQVSTDELAKK